MFLALKLALAGLIGASALLAFARPERYASDIEPFLGARYVVTGRVSPNHPPAPAHFSLEVVGATTREGPQPGRTINVRFVSDTSVVPGGGALIEIGLLGERDGVFLVGPGTQYRIVSPPPDVSNVMSTADAVTAVTWTVTAGAGAVAVCLLFVAIRSARRGSRRPVA